MRTTHGRLVLGMLALSLASFASIGVAAAQDAPGDVLIFSGPVTVNAGETIRSVTVMQGPTRIDGSVLGDVFALNGDVIVTGSVRGSIYAIGGTVHLLPGARVARDLVSAQSPSIAPGAFVGGAIQRPGAGAPIGAQIAGQLASWVAVTISLFLLALLLTFVVPASTSEAVYLAAQRRPLLALGVGVITAFALPAIALIAMFTIVGLPLGLALLAAMALFSCIGYVTAGWLVGRKLAETRMQTWPRAAWLMVGLGVLRLVALVPVVSLLVWLVSASVGFGALVLAIRAHRAGRPGAYTPMPPLPIEATT